MRTEYLDYIIDLSQTTSLSKTAQNYYTSHQVINNAVRNLEREFNITILQRSHYGIQFTEAGLIFLEYAKMIQSLIVELSFKTKTYQNPSNNLSGELTIVASAHYANTTLFDFSNRLIRTHPQISFQYQSIPTFNNVPPFSYISSNSVGLFIMNNKTYSFKDLQENATRHNLSIELLGVFPIGKVFLKSNDFDTKLTKSKQNQNSYVSYNHSLESKEFEISYIDNPDILKNIILYQNRVGILTEYAYQQLFKNESNVIFEPIFPTQELIYFIVVPSEPINKALTNFFVEKYKVFFKNQIKSKNSNSSKIPEV